MASLELNEMKSPQCTDPARDGADFEQMSFHLVAHCDLEGDKTVAFIVSISFYSSVFKRTKIRQFT